MNLHFPVYRKLWAREKAENRKLRDKNAALYGRMEDLALQLAAANLRADKATMRADALAADNNELRVDLASWMDRRSLFGPR